MGWATYVLVAFDIDRPTIQTFKLIDHAQISAQPQERRSKNKAQIARAPSRVPGHHRVRYLRSSQIGRERRPEGQRCSNARSYRRSRKIGTDSQILVVALHRRFETETPYCRWAEHWKEI